MPEFLITYKAEPSYDDIKDEKIVSYINEVLCKFVGMKLTQKHDEFSPIYHYQENIWLISIQKIRLKNFFRLLNNLTARFSLLNVSIISEKITQERLNEPNEYNFIKANSWLKFRNLSPTESTH